MHRLATDLAQARRDLDESLALAVEVEEVSVTRAAEEARS